MMSTRLAATCLPASLALLSACGGSGGGVASTPTPTPTPTATPTPTPTPTPPPIPSGAIGLQGAQPFKTYSARTDGWGSINAEADAVHIAYSAADGRYSVSLPGYQEGTLIPRSGNGSYNAGGWVNLTSTNSDLTVGSGLQTQYVTVTLDWPGSSAYSYTSFGSWSGSLPMGHNNGVFAYGTPTATANMPVSGTANYAGEIRGLTNGEPYSPGGGVGPVLDVFGTVALSFDFGAGTLSGEMRPEIAPVWDAVSLGTYSFRDTVYSTGGRSFSGAFIVPGSTAHSSFFGSFTGPNGVELMANWLAPFRHPTAESWGTMSGVWVAKQRN